MKNTLKWIFLLIPLVYSCFDDKGNYNYTELNKITVENITYNNNINYGDPLDITPKLKFALDSTNVELKYEWIINEIVVDSTPELHIESFKYYTGGRRCYFRVQDVATGMKYVEQFYVSVSGTYQFGWLILSEKDQKSSLTYVREQKKEDKDGNIEIIYGYETDVYKKVNGQDLGSGPIQLLEHWTTGGRDVGEILVLQKSGSVDLEGNTMLKAIDTEKEFLNEKYPDNFVPKLALYTNTCGYLVSEDGKTYSRNNADPAAFHSGRFMRNPMMFEGKTLNCTHTIMTSTEASKGVLLFDKQPGGKGRYIAMMDYYYYAEKSGNPTAISLKDYPEGFSDLNAMDRELIYSSFQNDDNWDDTRIFSILFDKEESKYYIQNFLYEVEYWTGNIKVTPNFEEPFAGSPNITSQSVFALARKTPFIYFSGGANNNELYFCNLEKGTTLCEKAKITYTSPIASIAVSTLGNRIGVALENGEFYLLDADALRTDKTLYHIPVDANIGKVKHCIFKLGVANNFIFGDED